MKNISTLKFMPIILVSQFIKESTGHHTFCSIPWNLMNFSQIQRIYLPQSKDNNSGSGRYLYVQFFSDKKSVLFKTSVKKERNLSFLGPTKIILHFIIFLAEIIVLTLSFLKIASPLPFKSTPLKPKNVFRTPLSSQQHSKMQFSCFHHLSEVWYT